MDVRAGERGAVMQTKWAMALLVAMTLVVSTAGCGQEETVGAPSVAEFEAERQALANRKKPGKNKANNKTGKAGKNANKTARIAGAAGYASGDQDYFYDARGKRDPFRSIRFDDDDQEQKSFGPLGDFELGQLELSAVIWDATNPRALILDPGGRSYIVSEGASIGKNNGQVIHIGDNLVLVKETYEDFAGERTTKDVEMRIRLSQGG
jgi:type IV pilus assembly protein PilP